ncbi:unnamed protein product [Adineta steineri]|uniref:Uncharacterized protein n=1 Tax=Adineta steineri TaxID=433720 RepID=A0A820A9J2_9BILA|nr:unnamed protein product [Adineta steineri]
MTQSTQQLRIIAQPKALYRERYGSEQCETGNRFQRYIRAEDNQLKLEYPTIEVRKSNTNFDFDYYTEQKSGSTSEILLSFLESLAGQSRIFFGLKTGIRTIQKFSERGKLDLRQKIVQMLGNP